MMLFDTARNWGDTELTAMPGYRDRVAHVALADDEGGLNMPPDTVRAIGALGECAGRCSARASRPIPARTRRQRSQFRLTWDNQVRYGSFMAAFELVNRRFRATCPRDNWSAPLRTYPQLLNRI
jgi:hypothetical protein